MYEIETIEQYNEVKNRESAYNEWVKQYLQKNGWIVIPTDVIPPVEFGNDDRSALELWEWKTNPPEKYSLYIKEAKNPPAGFPYKKPVWLATTWTGQKLGNVRYGKEYSVPAFGGFRSRRVPVTVYGNNGVKYYGTYYRSSGDYARIKRMKTR